MSQNVALDSRFPISVLDVVLMGRLGNGGIGFYSREDIKASEAALENVGLRQYRQRRFSALSGGQQRRLLIARALAAEPKILLLDEPTANLDLYAEKELYELLKKLNRELTIVLVSHDPSFVSDFVKRVICVNCELHEHPTAEITGTDLAEFYGGARRMVQHDRHLNGEAGDG
jgi:zinc transport system ATP-binding protein